MRLQAPEGVLGNALCGNPGYAGAYGLVSRMTAQVAFGLFRAVALSAAVWRMPLALQAGSACRTRSPTRWATGT